jgi:ribosomal protein L40E
MTIGTRGPLGLAPGEEIAISYDLIAPDPSPENKKVVAPLRAEFSAERFGPVCGRDCASPPSIKVIHNRRDFSAGKQAIPLGGKGRYEVLILFENNGDTALQDIYINDVIPTNFEIKDWYIKGASGKRDDCEMTTEDNDLGVQASWMVPMVGKGERIEVCFEIKGSGEVDGDILNKFHGVHFGDEIESDELPEAAPEEVAEEVTEEAESSEATSEDDPVDAAPTVTWREDVLLRVMESHEISVEDRDAFVAHAINFDHDDNGYLKKAELEDAAKAWTTDSSEEDGEEEVVNAEEETGESQEKVCPVCSANTPADAITCASCGWTFES